MTTGNPYAAAGSLESRVAALATADARTAFLQKTYLHLAGAILAFVGVEALVLRIPGIEQLALRMTTGYAWFAVLALFMATGWVSDRWARSDTSPAMQYAGLGLSIVAHAFVFMPLIYAAVFYAGPTVIPTAGIITLTLVAGLTASVFLTGKDFSFLRPALTIGGFVAMGLIACAIIPGIGLTLGTWFSAAMVIFAGGAILYSTSNVLHHYRTEQHVAAALSLFGSVALLFYYVLQLVMSLSSRD